MKENEALGFLIFFSCELVAVRLRGERRGREEERRREGGNQV